MAEDVTLTVYSKPMQDMGEEAQVIQNTALLLMDGDEGPTIAANGGGATEVVFEEDVEFPRVILLKLAGELLLFPLKPVVTFDVSVKFPRVLLL
jgi:hypothetical protein